MNEPWWIKDDRALLEIMRSAIKGKPESAVVRYRGDQRPQLVEQVRIDIDCLEKRIEADIRRFNEVGGDYDKMDAKPEDVTISRDSAEVIHRMLVEFFHAKNLSPEETTALMNLSSAGNFGRPVPEHGSGPVALDPRLMGKYSRAK